MDQVLYRDLDQSLSCNDSWNQFGKIVSYFRRWRRRHTKIQHQKAMALKGARAAKYQMILRNISLRECARGYFRTWRMHNRLGRRNRRKIFQSWQKMAGTKKVRPI